MEIEILKHSDIFQTTTVLIHQSTWFILIWGQQNCLQYTVRSVLYFSLQEENSGGY